MIKTRREQAQTPSVGRQLSLAEVLLLVVLAAVWFAIYQLIEQLAMCAFATLLCAVSTLLVRLSPKDTKPKSWKTLLAAVTWLMLYVFSAGPVIMLAQGSVHHRVLTTIYPFVRADIPMSKRTEGKLRYRLRGTPGRAIRRYFDTWWD